MHSPHMGETDGHFLQMKNDKQDACGAVGDLSSKVSGNAVQGFF